jgi:hypothetical protein
VRVACNLYLPNGNPQPGPKFDYKLAWMERLRARCRQHLADEMPAVVLGDFNVIPEDKDVWSVRAMADDALMQPESRDAYARCCWHRRRLDRRDRPRSIPRGGVAAGVDLLGLSGPAPGSATTAFASTTVAALARMRRPVWIAAGGVDKEPVFGEGIAGARRPATTPRCGSKDRLGKAGEFGRQGVVGGDGSHQLVQRSGFAARGGRSSGGNVLHDGPGMEADFGGGLLLRSGWRFNAGVCGLILKILVRDDLVLGNGTGKTEAGGKRNKQRSRSNSPGAGGKTVHLLVCSGRWETCRRPVPAHRWRCLAGNP